MFTQFKNCLFRIKFKYFSFANMYPIREVRCEEDLQFRHPFNGLIAGPSQCGKTTLLRQILESHEQTIAGINREIIKVAWCYGKWQPSYEIPLKGVDLKYINGMPEEEDIFGFDIIILDDLIHEIEKSRYVSHLFTAGTHHDNQSVMILTQNYYQKGEICNTLRKNTHYVILFKDPGDMTIVRTMAWRMFPDNPQYFIDAFKLATSTPRGYLLVDRHQLTDDENRLRTNIVPTKETDWIFQPIGFELIKR